ncbi:MAG: hypothetical protein M0R17_13405 [Candidatus Omnitrophica bacterium]|jgi:hypothetical protein|nr:hypothetical protein [Candidatus Omnitrophota bacterium]
MEKETSTDLPSCLTCTHWKQKTFYVYDGAINDGICNKLKTELYIDLITDWGGGYVKSIETPSNFGCTLHDEYKHF